MGGPDSGGGREPRPRLPALRDLGPAARGPRVPLCEPGLGARPHGEAAARAARADGTRGRGLGEWWPPRSPEPRREGPAPGGHGPRIRTRYSLGRAPAGAGPPLPAAEGGPAPPLPAPASRRRPRGDLGPPGASGPAARALRAAYAASGWRVASPRPARSAGGRNFPSEAPTSPGLPREEGGATPDAANRRSGNGPVRPRGGRRGLPGGLAQPNPGTRAPASPARGAVGSVPGQRHRETF